MTNSITPPNELAQQWYRDAEHQLAPYYVFVARCAAQWGADQELTECLRYASDNGLSATRMRETRRPKPPSLKEQALALVEQHEEGWRPSPKDWDTIRRALEALPND